MPPHRRKWIGLGLGVLGIIIIVLWDTPSYLHFLGSICSIAGFIWFLLDDSATRIESGIDRMEALLRQMLEEMRRGR